jgi:hypothetical protein
MPGSGNAGRVEGVKAITPQFQKAPAQMAMSKAYKGLSLPAEYKRHACGHMFRASHCKVCPTCHTIARRAVAVSAPVAVKPADQQVEKAAQALRLVLGGKVPLATCREAVTTMRDQLDQLAA